MSTIPPTIQTLLNSVPSRILVTNTVSNQLFALSRPTGNTVHDLLPYCTTEPPLNEAQVIALSDVVGSLRELVPLALAAAAGDKRSLRKLESAVGKRDAVGVVEFFVDEWEIEG
ncbi:hypothetical protein BM1_00813 [Bipolaris maydis]|nr:hypothetical protein BM1_00813 [Bipolaris maydis]